MTVRKNQASLTADEKRRFVAAVLELKRSGRYDAFVTTHNAFIVGDTDNAQNQGFFGVVVAAAACSFVARLRPDGMARAMLATAGVQALLGLMVATAPVTARVEPMGPGGVLLLSGLFVALWLVSAALFQWSAHHEQPGAAV